ncbi:TFPI [Mytilus edulis]|uniref:TFPI n=1 Tax=Mytilus edulis TaxID=6550 RepID=A0A8S3RAR0_MYTED|nr:TFPI [Mytilus edulis]
MQVLVVLLFVFVVVEAYYYDRGRTPSCKFPCPWRGKTFDFWEIGNSTSGFYGKFSKDGRTIWWSFNGGRTDECYQILDGFLVLRIKGEDNWFCVKTQYDRTKRPATFRIHNGCKFETICNTKPINECIGEGTTMCQLPSDKGPCRAVIQRYFYNQRSSQCETFEYGGCAGNANNFESLSSCQRTCP